MSDVEKMTFDNHNRRRSNDMQNAWERRASESAKAREKQQRIRSWMLYLACASFMAFGATVSLTGVFAAMGDQKNLAVCVAAAGFSIICGLFFAEKIER